MFKLEDFAKNDSPLIVQSMNRSTGITLSLRSEIELTASEKSFSIKNLFENFEKTYDIKTINLDNKTANNYIEKFLKTGFELKGHNLKTELKFSYSKINLEYELILKLKSEEIKKYFSQTPRNYIEPIIHDGKSKINFQEAYENFGKSII